MSRTREIIAAFEKPSNTFKSTEATRYRRSWRRSAIRSVHKAPAKYVFEDAPKPTSAIKVVQESSTIPDLNTSMKGTAEDASEETSAIKDSSELPTAEDDKPTIVSTPKEDVSKQASAIEEIPERPAVENTKSTPTLTLKQDVSKHTSVTGPDSELWAFATNITQSYLPAEAAKPTVRFAPREDSLESTPATKGSPHRPAALDSKPNRNHTDRPPKSPIKSPIKKRRETASKHRSITRLSLIPNLKQTTHNQPKSSRSSTISSNLQTVSNAPGSPTKHHTPIDKNNPAVKPAVEERLSAQIQDFSTEHERLEEELLRAQIENEGLRKRQLELEESLQRISRASAVPPMPASNEISPVNSRPTTQLMTTIDEIIGDHEEDIYRELSAQHAKLRGQQRATRERYESLKQEHQTLVRRFDSFATMSSQHIGTLETRLRDIQDKKTSALSSGKHVWRQDVQAAMRQMWRELRATQVRCSHFMETLVYSARARTEDVQSRQSQRPGTAMSVSSPDSSAMYEKKKLPELPGAKTPVPRTSTPSRRESLSQQLEEVDLEADRSPTL